MKINKRDPKHWLYLARSGTYILTSIAARPFWRKNKRKIVTLFGHKYNGNLKAFAEYCLGRGDYHVQFVTLDPAYFEELRRLDNGVEFLFLQNFRHVLKVSRSDAVVSDRRAHVLVYYLWLTRMPFFDVWHGIQMFKRFSPKDMAMLKSYREIWVPSPAFAKVYADDYHLPADKIKVTGYGRVDQLVNGAYDTEALRKKYNIEDKFKKVILLAPTWQQDDPTRQVIPFGEDPGRFLGALNDVAKQRGALVVFRAHLNTNAQNRANLQAMDHIRTMSHNDYPLGEEFLAFSDIFIGDWSSIAFDYLPLHRPAIFLQVPVPFRYGLTFGEEHQYGERVGSLAELTAVIEHYLDRPEDFMKEHGDQVAQTERLAYGDTLDGKSCQRYYERLQAVIGV
jgi:CDP-glycerol glycerophosphotransferase